MLSSRVLQLGCSHFSFRWSRTEVRPDTNHLIKTITTTKSYVNLTPGTLTHTLNPTRCLSQARNACEYCAALFISHLSILGFCSTGFSLLSWMSNWDTKRWNVCSGKCQDQSQTQQICLMTISLTCFSFIWAACRNPVPFAGINILLNEGKGRNSAG